MITEVDLILLSILYFFVNLLRVKVVTYSMVTSSTLTLLHFEGSIMFPIHFCSLCIFVLFCYYLLYLLISQ